MPAIEQGRAGTGPYVIATGDGQVAVHRPEGDPVVVANLDSDDLIVL